MATATTPNQVRALNLPPVVISLRAKRDRPNSHDRCRNSHFPPSFACLQDFDEIIAILKSKKNPRGIKVAVSALLWGEDYYASCDDSEKVVQGEIDRWQGPDKAVLMIRWTGYNRCQAAPLSTLRRAAMFVVWGEEFYIVFCVQYTESQGESMCKLHLWSVLSMVIPICLCGLGKISFITEVSVCSL